VAIAATLRPLALASAEPLETSILRAKHAAPTYSSDAPRDIA
jgi:hypothetical protein